MPYGVWTTSGWNWIPYRPRSAFSIAATGDSVEAASSANPGGASKTVSRWLIQQDWSAGVPASSRPGELTDEPRAPELADLGALDAAAQLEHHRLHAVTDAEHRHAELEQLAGAASARPRRRRTPARRRGSGRAAGGA